MTDQFVYVKQCVNLGNEQAQQHHSGIQHETQGQKNWSVVRVERGEVSGQERDKK